MSDDKVVSLAEAMSLTVNVPVDITVPPEVFLYDEADEEDDELGPLTQLVRDAGDDEDWVCKECGNSEDFRESGDASYTGYGYLAKGWGDEPYVETDGDVNYELDEIDWYSCRSCDSEDSSLRELLVRRDEFVHHEER